jgi:hypothetical protein
MSLNVLDRVKAGAEALVSSFWPLEVLNILLLGKRKGRTRAWIMRHCSRVLAAYLSRTAPAAGGRFAGNYHDEDRRSY